MKPIKDIMVALTVVTLIMASASCYYPKSKPGWEYMPDMANAISTETYSENTAFPDSMGSRTPVKGTIPRGPHRPFHFSAATSGYDSAGLMLQMPAGMDAADAAMGKHNFDIYCAVCHGVKGRGDGSIVTANVKNQFPPPPSYFRDDILILPVGKMYHSVHYGKNLMGSYTKVLNPDEVWQVLYYVKSMQQTYRDSVANAAAKSATTAAVADTTKK